MDMSEFAAALAEDANLAPSMPLWERRWLEALVRELPKGAAEATSLFFETPRSTRPLLVEVELFPGVGEYVASQDRLQDLTLFLKVVAHRLAQSGIRGILIEARPLDPASPLVPGPGDAFTETQIITSQQWAEAPSEVGSGEAATPVDGGLDGGDFP